jgi:hypothetical protein
VVDASAQVRLVHRRMSRLQRHFARFAVR